MKYFGDANCTFRVWPLHIHYFHARFFPFERLNRLIVEFCNTSEPLKYANALAAPTCMRKKEALDAFAALKNEAKTRAGHFCAIINAKTLEMRRVTRKCVHMIVGYERHLQAAS